MKNSFPILLLLVLAFASCQKEDPKNDTKIIKEDIKGDDKICFDLVYPISYTMPDGSSVTGADEDAVNTALKAWYTAHPDSKAKYTLDYPVDVIFKDGIVKTIEDEDGMIALKKYCEGEKDDCFVLIYPVSYLMPDGTTASGADEDAVNTALKAWYTAHPDSKAKYTLIYPVTIQLEDGTTQSITDDAAFEIVKKDCENKDG